MPAPWPRGSPTRASLPSWRPQGAKVDRRVWHTAGDELVRPAHASANGQVADGDLGTFMVGGTVMRYPGDPRAPVALIVRCRCTVSVTGTDVTGRRLAVETGRTTRGQVAPGTPTPPPKPTQPPLPTPKPKLPTGPAWARKADAAGEKILSGLRGLAAQAVKASGNKRLNLRVSEEVMVHRRNDTPIPSPPPPSTSGRQLGNRSR